MRGRGPLTVGYRGRPAGSVSLPWPLRSLGRATPSGVWLDADAADQVHGPTDFAGSAWPVHLDRVPAVDPVQTAARAPMTSWNFAVSRYCWNLVSFPSLTSQMWQTCASRPLPLSLWVAVYRASTTTVSPAS